MEFARDRNTLTADIGCNDLKERMTILTALALRCLNSADIVHGSQLNLVKILSRDTAGVIEASVGNKCVKPKLAHHKGEKKAKKILTIFSKRNAET